MNLLSVASAFPEKSFTQNDCLEAMQVADFWGELNARSRLLLGKVLSGDSGIDKRHFALDQICISNVTMGRRLPVSISWLLWKIPVV